MGTISIERRQLIDRLVEKLKISPLIEKYSTDKYCDVYGMKLLRDEVEKILEDDSVNCVPEIVSWLKRNT